MLFAFLVALQPDLAAERNLKARLAAEAPAVRRFIERRAMCNHFGGEEPYDEARRREILAAVTEYRCERLGRDEAKLRRLYRHRPATLRLLTETTDLSGWVD